MSEESAAPSQDRLRLATLPELVGSDGIFADGDWIESKDQDPDGGVRLVQLADIGDGIYRDRSNRFLTMEKAKELNCTFLKSGDILIARMPDPLGRACIFPGDEKPSVTAVDVCIVRPGSEDVNPSWLLGAINAPQFRSRVASLQSGTTRKRISRRNLGSIQIPIPPKDEQDLTTSIVEQQLTRLDAAVAALQRAKANLSRFRASTLQAVSLGRLKPDLLSPSIMIDTFHQDALRPEHLPTGWALVGLGEVLERIEGGKSFRCETRPARDDEWGVVKVSAMTWGIFKEGENKAIPGEVSVDSRLEIKSGDLLFSRANTIEYVGAAVLVPSCRQGLVLSDKSLRLIPSARVTKQWLLLVLRSPLIRRQIESVATGTSDSMRNISQAKIKELIIPLPPLKHQFALVAEGERYLSLIDGLEPTVRTELKRAQALRQAVLAHAFAGKLAHDNPPAAEIAPLSEVAL